MFITYRLERRAKANAKSVKFGETEADRRVSHIKLVQFVFLHVLYSEQFSVR